MSFHCIVNKIHIKIVPVEPSTKNKIYFPSLSNSSALCLFDIMIVNRKIGSRIPFLVRS